jgi:hypothetical protein
MITLIVSIMKLENLIKFNQLDHFNNLIQILMFTPMFKSFMENKINFCHN